MRFKTRLLPTDGATIRGCKSSLPSQLINFSFLCNSSACNNNIYPENRLTCYQCTDSDTDCIKEPKAFPCVTFAPDDSCYTTFNGVFVTRGCSSDTPSKLDICEDQIYCTLCKLNNCNNDIDDAFCGNSGIFWGNTLVKTKAVISIWIILFFNQHL